MNTQFSVEHREVSWKTVLGKPWVTRGWVIGSVSKQNPVKFLSWPGPGPGVVMLGKLRKRAGHPRYRWFIDVDIDVYHGSWENDQHQKNQKGWRIEKLDNGDSDHPFAKMDSHETAKIMDHDHAPFPCFDHGTFKKCGELDLPRLPYLPASGCGSFGGNVQWDPTPLAVETPWRFPHHT